MDKTKKILIEASFKDSASAGIRGLGGSTQNLEQNLRNLGQGFTNVGRRMTILSGIAIGLTAVISKQVITAAMDAEGAWNKFGTVFAEHGEEMTDWVKEIRQIMPMAETRIVRMASGLQDLLIPMGLGRDRAKELTKETMELVNQIAAFNDADPSDVMDAMISGFTGMARPLRQYGIDVSDAALETHALNVGLLEQGQTFQNIDPLIKNQIRSQALLSKATIDSADAIAGFEVNQDSALRRTQELSASFEDQKEKLGFALLPIYDQALKAIIPVVQEIGLWIEANQELIQQIMREFLSALKDLVFWLKDEVVPVVIEVAKNIRSWMKENPELAKQLVRLAGVLAVLFVALGPVLMILGTLFTMIAGVLGAGTLGVLAIKIVAIGAALAGVIITTRNAFMTFKQLFETIFSIAINQSNALRLRVENLSKSFEGWLGPLQNIWALLSRITSVDLGVVSGAISKMGDRQSGGMAHQSGFYDVGEHGRERVFLPQGSRVVNATDTARETNGKGAVNITNNFSQVDMDVDTLAQKLSFQLKYL